MSLALDAPAPVGFGEKIWRINWGLVLVLTAIAGVGVLALYSAAGGRFEPWAARNAMRYGVALGSEAFGWTGEAVIDHKAEWPDWNPPADMVARWPQVKKTAGGWTNPLGARAMYLFQEGKDTLYRIHGTNEPEKIGQSVSSGCIRMRNIDVIDLYSRVQDGTKVIVR